jgi:phosphoribosylformylglycinamidine synthase
VAAAEMAFAGGLGMTLNVKNVPLGEAIDRDDFILFSESNTRFLAEVAPADKEKFEKAMAGADCALVGQVTDTEKLEIYGRKGKMLISAGIDELKEAWQKPLRW